MCYIGKCGKFCQNNFPYEFTSLKKLTWKLEPKIYAKLILMGNCLDGEKCTNVGKTSLKVVVCMIIKSPMKIVTNLSIYAA